MAAHDAEGQGLAQQILFKIELPRHFMVRIDVMLVDAAVLPQKLTPSLQHLA